MELLGRPTQIVQPEALTKLAVQLHALRETARIVPFVRDGIGDGSAPDDWKPTPKFCHANVDVWVLRSPEYATVRGWVVFNQSHPLIPQSRFRFVAHSVIEASDGRFLDITPSLASQPYPFIRHSGSTEEFDELRM